MDLSLAQVVRRRADGRCEYCRVPEAFYPGGFHVDHVIARQHGGVASLDNLALACLDCNLRKGPNVAGIDPEGGTLTPLFHPRRDRWSDHFAYEGARVVGRSAIGRTTIATLGLNREERLAVRETLMEEGVVLG